MKTAIEIGVNPATVEEIGKIITRIISSDCGEQAKVEAFLALKKTCNVNNCTIQHCNFWADGKIEQEGEQKGEQEDAG